MNKPETFSKQDADHMARALELAALGLYTTDPNPRVGCVIVRDGKVLGEGFHQRAGGPHAEIAALKEADGDVRGATAYVSLEPCCHHGKTPPCSQALIDAGVSRVVAAMRDPNPLVAGKGLQALSDAGIRVASGLLSHEAEALNIGFCKRMRTGLPWVVSKLAMSLDGRTAMASGESRWITDSHSRQDVHRLRARSSAILTSISTVLADDPELNARIADEVLQPARIILDSNQRMPVHARLLKLPGRNLVLTLEGKRAEALQDAGAEVHGLPADERGRLDLKSVFELLGKLEFNEILVEAGPTLNGSLMQSGFVDEWLIYMAPCILGDSGRGLFHLPGLDKMADRIDLKLIETRQLGRDLRLKYRKPDLVPKL